MRVLRRNGLYLNALERALKRQQRNNCRLHLTRGPQSRPCSEYKGRCTLKVVVQARVDFYLPLTKPVTVTLVSHICCNIDL